MLFVEGLVHEVEAAVGQAPETREEELVERASVDDGPLELLAVELDRGKRGVLGFAFKLELEHAFRLGVQTHLDILVVEHLLEQLRVAEDGHALVGVLEVAVIARDENRNARRHRRVDFLGREPPLLLRVVQKDIFVHEIGDLSEFGIVLLAQLVDSHLALVAEGIDELLDVVRGLFLAKRDFHRVLVEGHRHIGSVPIGEHAMLIPQKTGEAARVVEGALVVGVEDVRAVLVYEDARLVFLIVHVAADMGALFDDENALARALRKFASHDATGESAADDNRVDVIHVHFVELCVLHAHVSFAFRSHVMVLRGRGKRARSDDARDGERPLPNLDYSTDNILPYTPSHTNGTKNAVLQG